MTPLHDLIDRIPDRIVQAVQDFVDGPMVVAQWGCPHGCTKRYDVTDPPLKTESRVRVCEPSSWPSTGNVEDEPCWLHDHRTEYQTLDEPVVLEGTEDGWNCDSERNCRNGVNDPVLWPVSMTPTQLMHHVLGIDYNEYMDEKDAMLEKVRSA